MGWYNEVFAPVKLSAVNDVVCIAPDRYQDGDGDSDDSAVIISAFPCRIWALSFWRAKNGKERLERSEECATNSSCLY